MTRDEFNVRWWEVLEEMKARVGHAPKEIQLRHYCDKGCCDDSFVSQRFSNTAVCSGSGKMHVCNIGGVCPDVTRTDTGDLICLMSRQTIGVDNLLPAYDQTSHSDMHYGSHIMGGIDAGSVSHTAAGGNNTGSRLDRLSEDSNMSPELASAMDEIARSSVVCATRTLGKKIPLERGAGSSGGGKKWSLRRSSHRVHAASSRKPMDARSVVVSTIEDIVGDNEDETLGHHDMIALTTYAPTVILQHFKHIGKDYPQGAVFLKAFVYAFLDILARKGVPKVQEGPMTELLRIMPRQNVVYKIGIDSSNISKAERALNESIKREEKLGAKAWEESEVLAEGGGSSES
jgi:hypothetical protein